MPKNPPIGGVVRQASIQAGMDVSDVAAETGLREDVLNKFFYGQRAIGTDELQKLMDLLGLVLTRGGGAPAVTPAAAAPEPAAAVDPEPAAEPAEAPEEASETPPEG